MKDIKKILKAELESCLTLSKQKGAFLLPTVSWRLLLSTGDLRLLPSEEFKAISDIYTIIENQNYESMQLRNTDISVISGLTGDRNTDDRKIKYQNAKVTSNTKSEEITADSIQIILNQKWWTT